LIDDDEIKPTISFFATRKEIDAYEQTGINL